MENVELNDKQLLLLEFVKEQHGEQKRKYTGEPYWHHPLAVSQKIPIIVMPGGVETALCHDLFEDTSCDFNKLYANMILIGYDPEFSYSVCTAVKQLSDVYIKEDYPGLNRAERKIKEAIRLGGCNFLVQSVKYSDIIDNTKSIVEHDPNFAKVYLREKRDLLTYMRGGQFDLYAEACYLYYLNINRL